MMKYILLLWTTLLLASCSGESYFWTKQKHMNPLETEEGTFLDAQSHTHIGQYSSFGDIMQEYRGLIKGSIVSAWKLVRLKGGKTDLNKVCGERPKHIEYTRNEIIHEADRIDRERAMYYKEKNLRRVCVKKYQAKDKSNEITHYYYARTTKTHNIVYPKKSERHSHWEANVYYGRVGDLTPEALTPEQLVEASKLKAYRLGEVASKPEVLTPKQLADTSKLRAHRCYQYTRNFGVPNKACYDLPGEEKNLYYSIRDVKRAKINPKSNGYQPQWESIMDVRISPPTPWTEVKGIEINQEMYNYLKDECYQERTCHLDDYKGSMTKEQKAYVKSVSWK